MLALMGSPLSVFSNFNAEKCDLLTGDWTPNPSGPLYTSETCHFIESHQDCLKNGRPDSGYLYWRWRPRDCELPQFDAKRFLGLMSNKSWALIGDSISRNHVQSLLCILTRVHVRLILLEYQILGCVTEWEVGTKMTPFFLCLLNLITITVINIVFTNLHGLSCFVDTIKFALLDQKEPGDRDIVKFQNPKACRSFTIPSFLLTYGFYMYRYLD